MIKSLKVGPYRFTVETTDMNRGAAIESMGITIPMDQRILIEKGVKGDVLADTLLHELLHVCWFVAQIDKDREEETIRALTPWLLLALRENPKLLEFLLNSV